MVPPDMVVLGPGDGLPVLPDAEIALIKARTALPRAAGVLADYVLNALDRQRGHASTG